MLQLYVAFICKCNLRQRKIGRFVKLKTRRNCVPHACGRYRCDGNAAESRGSPLLKQIAVGTETAEVQSFRVWLVIDQEQIRLEVAFPMADPFGRKRMIAMPSGQRLICRQQFNNRQEQVVKLAAEPSREGALVVFLELLRPQDRPHSNPR
jgi:hypothetical protein